MLWGWSIVTLIGPRLSIQKLILTDVRGAKELTPMIFHSCMIKNVM